MLAELPPWLWADKRRQRSHVNQVLARAEVRSSYQPARRLWVRARNGHYFPNPGMQLRTGDAWRPVYEMLALDWLDRGSAPTNRFAERPADAITRVGEIAAGRVEAPEGSGSDTEPKSEPQSR